MARVSDESSSLRHEISGSELTIVVDKTVYSREALLRACYWFTDRCYLSISPDGPNSLSVRIRGKPDGPELSAVAGEFENALLDAQLRVEIGCETTKIRELIVAKAFAEGDVLEDPPMGEWHGPATEKGKT
jgi:His-Xaa-Ser system protein HxsD